MSTLALYAVSHVFADFLFFFLVLFIVFILTDDAATRKRLDYENRVEFPKSITACRSLLNG